MPSATAAAATTTAGKLPARSRNWSTSCKGKVDLSDTLLWWVAGGVDAVNLIAKAVEETGRRRARRHHRPLEQPQDYPGYFGDYTLSRRPNTTAIRPRTS